MKTIIFYLRKEKFKMNEEIKRKLEKEISDELETLNDLEFGSDEEVKAVDNLVKLYKLKIEEDESQMKIEKEKSDKEFKEKQLREQVKDRYFRTGIAVGEVVLPLIFYGIWMNKGFKFEETGTFTSGTFRNLINCFKPKKR